MPLAVAAALLTVIAVTAGSSALTSSPGASAAGARCDRFVAPGGSDRAAGTRRHPWRRVQHLVDHLRGGQRGCLKPGTYHEDVSVGRSHITLAGAGGGRATLVGRLWIKGQAHDDAVVGLHLDGRNRRHLPSPTVNGDRTRFEGNDVTNERTAVCFLLGSDGWGRAQGTIIRRNRIHDCGVLPAVNRQHGIYVNEADDTKILDNVIYDNADRGIQLYPDAQRTVIRGNVIDGNGEGIIFSGADGLASTGTVVDHNAVTFSRIRADIESWYPLGRVRPDANSVHDNCVFGGRRTIDTSGGGFVARRNRLADPRYRSSRQHDYRVASSSPCARLLAASQAPAGPHGERPVG